MDSKIRSNRRSLIFEHKRQPLIFSPEKIEFSYGKSRMMSVSLDDLSELDSEDDQLDFVNLYSNPLDFRTNDTWKDNFCFQPFYAKVTEDRSPIDGLVGNYPRLQSSFYRKLRKKYPVAFSHVTSLPDQPLFDGSSGTSMIGDNEDGYSIKDADIEHSLFGNGTQRNQDKGSYSSSQGNIVRSSKSMEPLLNKDSLRRHELRNRDIFEKAQRMAKNEFKESKMAATSKSASTLDLRQRIAENNAQLMIFREKLDRTLKSRGKLSSHEKLIATDVRPKAKRNEKLPKTCFSRNPSLTDSDRVSRGHVISPDSPPDSAIDMDSASLKSIMSGITDFGPGLGFFDYGPNHSALDLETRNLFPAEGGFENTEFSLDSHNRQMFGIGNREQNDNFKPGTIGWRHYSSNKELSSGTNRNVEEKPTSTTRMEVEKPLVTGKRQQYLQRELKHELLSKRLASYSTLPTYLPPEDEEVLGLAISNHCVSSGSHYDEVDDTDPRLGVLETITNSDIDRQIAERYRQRKGRSKSTLRKRRSLAHDAVCKNSEFSDLQNVTEMEKSCIKECSQIGYADFYTSNGPIESQNAFERSGCGNELSIEQGTPSNAEEVCENSHISASSKNCLEQKTEGPKVISKHEETIVDETKLEVSDLVLPVPAHFQESFKQNGQRLPHKTKESFEADNSLFNEVLLEIRSVASKKSRSMPDLSEKAVSRPYLERSNRSMSDSATVQKDFAEENYESANIHRARDDLTKVHFEENLCGKQRISEFSSKLPKYSPRIDCQNDSFVSVSELEPPAEFCETRSPKHLSQVPNSFRAEETTTNCPSTIETRNYMKPGAIVQTSVSDKFSSKQAERVLRSDSFAENNLTPFEISLYLDEDYSSENENVGEIFSAKQIHIEKSDSELEADDSKINNSDGHSLKPVKNEEGTTDQKGLNSVQSSLTSPTHSVAVHYRKKNKKDRQNIKPEINGHYRGNGVMSQEIQSNIKGHNPCMVTSCSPIAHIEASKYQKSNLQSSKELSKSKLSLFGSAKAKISSLRKAKSLDHINQSGYYDEGANKENYHGNSIPMSTLHRLPPPPPPPGRVKKAPSLRSLLNMVKKGKNRNNHKTSKERPQSAHIQPPLSHNLRKAGSLYSLGVDMPTHPRAIGKLLELKPDGTQRVELIRPPHGPFGIYIARATAQYNYSVFVTRFSDGHPEKLFAGLLNVGDEILEINEEDIRNLSLDEVYDLMGLRDAMVLRTIPIWNRKETMYL